MSSSVLGRGRFRASVPFAQVSRFSQEYMRRHLVADDFNRRKADLVYLVDALHLSIRHGLLDDRGSPRDIMWTEEATSMRCAWRPGLQVRYGEVNTWRGFDAGCRSGFMWESCSGSLLTAVKVAGSDDLYQLECLPQGSRTSCEFMQIWGDLGVEFVDVLPGSQEFDEEPDWGTIEDRLSRPRSGC